MISTGALLMLLLSALFPSIFAAGTVQGDVLTLKAPEVCPSRAYDVKLSYAIFASIDLEGRLSGAGAINEPTASLENAQITGGAPKEPVKMEPTKVKFDKKMRTAGDGAMPCDLFALFGTTKLSFPVGVAKKYDVKLKNLHAIGSATYTGTKDGFAIVEASGTVDAGKQKLTSKHLLRFRVSDGQLEDIQVDLNGPSSSGCHWTAKRAEGG